MTVVGADAGPPRMVGQVVRYVLVARFAMAAVTCATLIGRSELIPPLLFCLVLLVGGNLLALRYWDVVATTVRVADKPWYLGLDVLLSTSVLLVVGTGAPLVLYLVGTVVLAGLVYSRALTVLTEVVVLTVYGFAQVGEIGFVPAPLDQHTDVTIPTALLGGGFAGLAIRRLLERQAADHDHIVALHEAAALHEERLRVARELHDTVTKNLHGLALLASAVESALRRDDVAAARASAALVARTAGEMALSTRGVIRDLRHGGGTVTTGPAAGEGLPAALARRLRDVVGGHPVTLDLQLDDVPPLDPEVRTQLLEVAAEAGHNTVKHARARRIAARLSVADGEVVLVLTDDGQGFDHGSATWAGAGDGSRGHYGLTGMRERVEGVGGVLRVESAPGRGTRVEVRLPCCRPVGGVGGVGGVGAALDDVEEPVP